MQCSNLSQLPPIVVVWHTNTAQLISITCNHIYKSRYFQPRIVKRDLDARLRGHDVVVGFCELNRNRVSSGGTLSPPLRLRWNSGISGRLPQDIFGPWPPFHFDGRHGQALAGHRGYPGIPVPFLAAALIFLQRFRHARWRQTWR